MYSAKYNTPPVAGVFTRHFSLFKLCLIVLFYRLALIWLAQIWRRAPAGLRDISNL